MITRGSRERERSTRSQAEWSRQFLEMRRKAKRTIPGQKSPKRKGWREAREAARFVVAEDCGEGTGVVIVRAFDPGMEAVRQPT